MPWARACRADGNRIHSARLSRRRKLMPGSCTTSQPRKATPKPAQTTINAARCQVFKRSIDVLPRKRKRLCFQRSIPVRLCQACENLRWCVAWPCAEISKSTAAFAALPCSAQSRAGNQPNRARFRLAVVRQRKDRQATPDREHAGSFSAVREGDC